MANRKITELTALTAPAADDVLPIIDVSEGVDANKNKKITFGSFTSGANPGSASLPSIAFGSDPDTGLYLSATNELSIATGGTQRVVVDATGNTTVKGDLVVQGATTTVSSTTLTVADKNIELAKGAGNDTAADGGGITLVSSDGSKEFKWINSTDSWTSSEHIEILSGKSFRVNGTNVLSQTTLGAGVVNSSLTSVGTLGVLAVTNAVTAGSLDISGGADIDGTMEADAYTVNGTALNVFIQDTVGAMVSSNTETNIAVSYDSTNNNLDFEIVSYPAASISGTTLASNVVTSSLTSVGTLGSLAVTNAVVAGSLDISGNADIDGTLETDALTIDGTALNEYIADTVGGMVAGGVETNITVTYDDPNNKLNFVIGTLNQNTTGNAATATALQTARTIGGVSFDGTGNITLPGVNAAGNQNTTGNAATSTALQNARTIGGVSFDGTANISLPGVNQTGNQNTTGSAATLTTARTIGGVSFDGSANISLPGVNAAGNQNTSGTAAGLTGAPSITVADVVAASLDISGNADIDGTLEADAYTVNGIGLDEFIADTIGGMVTTSNTETNITVTYEDSDNTLDFVIGTLNQNTTGSAATLTTARTIGGVSFDGSANINLPGVNAAGNQNTTGSAATLTTARTIGGVSFNGSANIDLPGVNATGNQGTSGNAATATALATARTIGGTSFDGTANITPANATNAVNVTGTIASAVTGTTQSAGNNSTKIATTAYADTAVANLVDGSPGALNTLNELAAALGDDANFSTTVTNSIATKLPLAGGTMSGAIDLGSNNITNGGTITGTFVGNVTGNTSGSSGSCTGNAATATALATARTIGGTSFDGSANIAVALAATATTLATARTIGGVSFNGSANIDLPGVNAVGNQNTTGSAATLTTARTIGGVSFNGSANISLPGVNAAGNQSTSGNAATATALATARAINGVNFDGTAPITITAAAGTLSGATLASGVTASSLTSVGTLTGLTISGDISMTGTGAIDVPTGTTAQRPGSPTTGHFRYNSTEGEFEGYTASGWGAIAGGGSGGTDFRYLALRNAANNGSASYPAADFTLVTSGTTNAITPTAANTLLVSVGGVIQQANTGTSTPTTGFAISGSTIKFGSSIAAAPDFIIYQLGAGIGTPSDNTVTLAKLTASGTASSSTYLRGDNSWASIAAGVGGATGADFNDGVKLRFGHDGSGNDATDKGEIYFDETNDKFRIAMETGSTLPIELTAQNIYLQGVAGSAYSAKFNVQAGQELYFGGTKKFETVSGGATTSGTHTATTFAGSGASLTALPAGELTGTVAAARIGANSITGNKIAMGSDAAGDVLYYNGTDYVRLPVGTAGQSLKVNSGASAPEWGTAAAGAKGGGSENIFWENEGTMNNSYTISTNYNAGVFGPLTVASGATLTVPSGSVLSIV